MAKVKKEVDLYTFLMILGKLIVCVGLHVIMYIYFKKFSVWWNGGKNNPGRRINMVDALNGIKKSSNKKVASAMQKLSSGDDEGPHKCHARESNSESSDSEQKFMKEMDRFCKMGTKIRKSEKSVRYIKAIHNKKPNVSKCS